MPENAAVIQSTQLGVETTAGTAVAASKALQGFSVSPTPKMNLTARTVPGYRYPVAVTRGKNWTEGSYDGFLSFTDATYLFSSLIKKVTPTAGSGGDAAARTWTFTSSLTATDTPQTYTVEIGDANLARRFAYGVVNTLSLSREDDGYTVSGAILGTTMETGVTKTASPTIIAPVPAAAVDSTVGFASTFAGAATALTRVLNVSCEFSERWKPVNNVSSSESWVALVDAETGFSAKLLLSADAVADGLIADRKAGTIKYFDWTIQGALVPGCSTAKYTTKVRAAVNITDVAELKDQDGVYAVEVTLTGVLDPTTSKAVEVTVINALTAL